MTHTKQIPLLAALVFMTAGFDWLEEDDLACEEVVAEIAACCPDVDPERFYCDFDDGCGGEPTLTVTEIECIDDMSCSEMEAARVCAVFAPDTLEEDFQCPR